MTNFQLRQLDDVDDLDPLRPHHDKIIRPDEKPTDWMRRIGIKPSRRKRWEPSGWPQGMNR
jgi:hypothetical protein